MRNPFEVYTSLNDNKKTRQLDWDESAADLGSSVEEVYDTDRTVPRLKWVSVLLMAVFSVFVVRLFNLQILQGEDFRVLAETNRVRSQTILAPRGLVIDRYGKVIAQNTASFSLVAVPFDLPKTQLDEMAGRLADMLGLNFEELMEKVKTVNRSSLDPVVLAQDITAEQSILFDTRASEFVGFSVQKIPVREYLDAPVFSHAVGYTGLLGERELASVSAGSYASIDFIGKSGVEQAYENFLHGVNGENMVEIDATGKLINVLGEKPPLPGSVVRLNLDKDLQKTIYDSLVKRNAGGKGAVVAINPKNGEVLAFLSLPGFDGNLFAHGIKKEQYQNLLNDKNLPLFNRVIAGTYPPGSTVKPMVAAAALQEGNINASTVIVDKGALIIPNQYNPAISYKFVGWKLDGLGPMNVYSAIAQSSDIFFYVVSGGHPSSPVEGLGVQKLSEYYRKFNLGKNWGIDIQGEKPGLVPDPEWKKKYFKDDPIMSRWYLGDTYHVGIGQGDLLVTPLQVAQWTAIIANNGTGYKPRLVWGVEAASGQVLFKNEPQEAVGKFLSDSVLKDVQKGMRETVLSGSGRQLASLPVSSAGKTGTSQFDGSDPSRTHAWFTAYAPFEDPQIAITVLVEAGGEGHAAAVPVARDALEWWAKNRYGKVIND